MAVLIARLSGIAQEMGAVLQRCAFSPNIKERLDASAAVFDAQGRILAQAEHIPVHLGSMPASVAAVIDVLGGRMGPGDQAIVNDPFVGGTHLNDITIVAPCFADRTVPDRGGVGELVGWVANRAHHADVGGMAPGSIPADATEVYQEGLRIPPVLLTDEVLGILCANSRTPVERSGDLAAQVGANEVGLRRLAELAGSPFGAVIDHGRRRCEAALGSLPEGTWWVSDVVDSTGPGADQQRPARLQLRLTVARSPGGGEHPRSITFDFTGTESQRSGNTNAVRAVTVSAVGFAMRAALDPTLPANAGVMAPVRVITPAGSLVDATGDVAVGAGNVEVSQRVADLCQRALAQALENRVPAAGQGTMNNVLVGGRGSASDATGRSWVYYETIGGGQGGRPPDPRGADRSPRPGASAIQVGMTNSRNTPIEVLERTYPLRVLRYRIRRRSGGAGWSSGGDGIERDLQVLEEVTVSLITERRVSQPWGLAGGEPGAVGENWLLPGGDEARAERLGDKCTLRLEAGDVLRMLTPGGGGWGDPTWPVPGDRDGPRLGLTVDSKLARPPCRLLQ